MEDLQYLKMIFTHLLKQGLRLPNYIEFPGAIYHLSGRGNSRVPIHDNSDRLEFLADLADLVEQYTIRCQGYRLIDNHYHLLIENPDSAWCSLFLKKLSSHLARRLLGQT